MTYPPVIQFETRALEVEARLRLSGELHAARPARHTSAKWRKLSGFGAPAERAALTRLQPKNCEQ
jgi:hypothetical protein